MAAYSKFALSASTNGKSITVATDASEGTTIHTAVDNETDWDELWLYAMNNTTENVLLTVQWGGTETSDSLQVTIGPQNGLYLVVPGLVLQNEAVVRAFAGSANVIRIYGYVNRISAV